MVCCSVFGCNNNHRNKELTFFRFPKDEQLRKQWIWACRRSDELKMSTARICSVHFQASDHYRSLQHELLGYTPKCCRKLKVDAVPSVHLPMRREPDTGRTEARMKRIAKRDRHKLINEMLTASTSSVELDQVSAEKVNLNNDVYNTNVEIKESQPQNNISGLNTESSRETVAQVEMAECSQQDVNDKIIQLDEAEIQSANKSLMVDDQPVNQEIIFITYDDTATDAQSSKDKLIRVLLNENKALKSELTNLKRHLKQINTDRKSHIREILKPIFTEGQIKCLLQDYRKRIQWSAEDIASAIALRSVSVNAYRYLRNNLNYPLPAVSTLRRCAAAKSFNGGVTEQIIQDNEEKSNETENEAIHAAVLDY